MTNNEEEEQVDLERAPKFGVGRIRFSCPISPYIMWYRGLMFASCPVNINNRDMPACAKCMYKGATTQEKKKQEKMPIIEIKKERTAIPKIGKPYHSE